MLPLGTILVPASEYMVVPVSQFYIVPMLQQVPNPNDCVFTMQQTTPVLWTNVSNSSLNDHENNTIQRSTIYPITSADDLSYTNMENMNNSYDIHDTPYDLIDDDDDNETSIYYLSDSDNSDIVYLNSSSDMSISNISDTDNDDDHDDEVDDYVDNDDDEPITGGYWL
ncbi:unnamed protein product [Adineta ricciae]|uniref:Uncharacterized protein n=1 Tax=Adineta ricciae TaxID=249248 RepID=A0A815SAX6_ADIRI|nr:unnamed protein product [Adineta ricciae]CAF1591688.1 unnamed protein product [Adineta ricciae]